MSWARAWHELGQLTFPSPAYSQALERITNRFTGLAQHGAPRPTLAALRSNEFALGDSWELRQFGLGRNGLLEQQPVDLTPDTSFLAESPVVSDFINRFERPILFDRFVVPLRLDGQPFRGGSSINLFQAWLAPGVRNPEARQRFSLNTCNGCHSAPETGTNFVHVEARDRGKTSLLWGYLQGIALLDPVTHVTRVFNELGRRKRVLEQLACELTQPVHSGTYPAH